MRRERQACLKAALYMHQRTKVLNLKEVSHSNALSQFEDGLDIIVSLMIMHAPALQQGLFVGLLIFSHKLTKTHVSFLPSYLK